MPLDGTIAPGPAPHERIVGLYDQHAAAWDAVRQYGPAVEEMPWLERFAAALAPGAHVLDLGCGGGIPVARDLLRAGLRVTGVDSSPQLIGLCRERFPTSEWHVADMRRLALERRFDGLLAWHSFFHLAHDDQRAMFPIFRRHIVPNGLLMFTTGPEEGESIGVWQDEALYHASLDPDEYRQLLTDHGFEVLLFSGDEHRGRSPYVWLARSTA